MTWPLGAPLDECVNVKHLNCFSCGAYNGFERGLAQHEYKKQSSRTNYTSKFLTTPSLEVVPVNEEFSDPIAKQVRPHRVKPNQISVIRAD